MPKFDGQIVTIYTQPLPDEKGIKRVDYSVTDKASGPAALVQF